VEGDPDNWKFLNNAAQAHVLAGTVAGALAPGEVEGHQRELLRFARRLHELQPRRAEFLFLWAAANLAMARNFPEASHYQEALPYAEAAWSLSLQLFAGDPRSFRYASQLQFASMTLFEIQRELGLRQPAEAALDRAQVAANIAGESTPVALFLVATAAARIPPECLPETVREIEERVLQLFQALLLSPGTSVEMTESAVLTFHRGWAHLSPELCKRLLAVDERVGRKVASLLEVDPTTLDGLAAREPSTGR
jgi:hypothetical protein